MATGKPFGPRDFALNVNSPLLAYEGGVNYDPTALRQVVAWGQRKLFISDMQVLLLGVNLSTMPEPQVVVAGSYPGTHFIFLADLWPEVHFHLYDPKFADPAHQAETARILRQFNYHGPTVSTDNRDSTTSDPTEDEDSNQGGAPRVDAAGQFRIRVYAQVFTDNDAKEWAKVQATSRNVIFISDIRRIDHNDAAALSIKKFNIAVDAKGIPTDDPARVAEARIWATAELERSIWEDMTFQQEWVRLIKPAYASLKFRLPYPRDKTDTRAVEYLAGNVYIQPWAPATSSETRLVPRRNAAGEYYTGSWNLREYDGWLYYHNRVTRRQNTYLNFLTNDNHPPDAPELLNDYDSMAETRVWEQYLQYRGGAGHLNIPRAVVSLSRLLTIEIHRGRLGRAAAMVTLEGKRSYLTDRARSVFVRYDSHLKADPARAAGQVVHELIQTKDAQLAEHITTQGAAVRQRILSTADSLPNGESDPNPNEVVTSSATAGGWGTALSSSSPALHRVNGPTGANVSRVGGLRSNTAPSGTELAAAVRGRLSGTAANVQPIMARPRQSGLAPGRNSVNSNRTGLAAFNIRQ